MPIFDPSLSGIFIFGLIAGICPCNSVLCLGLIGYLTSGNTTLSLSNILKLTISFSIGTILVLLPLGWIAGYIGQYLLFLNEQTAWFIGGALLILMGLQLLHLYKPPDQEYFQLFQGSDLVHDDGSICSWALIWCDNHRKRGSYAPDCPDIHRPEPDCCSGSFYDPYLRDRVVHPSDHSQFSRGSNREKIKGILQDERRFV